MKHIINNHIAKFKKQKVLIENFSYLTILQLVGLLIPFITYPYLIRVLGKSTYGLVVYSQAIASFLIILVNFGFNISATKDISIHRNNKIKLQEIISSVISIKIFLFFSGILLLSILMYLIEDLKEYWYLHYLSMGLCISETLFPIWYFLGIERMKYITLIQLTMRLIFASLIFIFIKYENQFWLVPLFNGIGAIVGSIIALRIIIKVHKNKLKWQKYSILKGYFYDSLPFFASRAATVITTQASTVIIGSFISMVEVSYYDLALKISNLGKIPFNLINQTIYSRIARTKDMNFVYKITKYGFLFSLFVFAFIWIFNNTIIQLLGGAELIEAYWIIIIISISIPIVSISYNLGNCVLVVNNKNRDFNRSVIIGSLLYIISVIILSITGFINLLSVSYLSVIVELYILLHRLKYSIKFLRYRNIPQLIS